MNEKELIKKVQAFKSKIGTERDLFNKYASMESPASKMSLKELDKLLKDAGIGFIARDYVKSKIGGSFTFEDFLNKVGKR